MSGLHPISWKPPWKENDLPQVGDPVIKLPSGLNYSINSSLIFQPVGLPCRSWTSQLPNHIGVGMTCEDFYSTHVSRSQLQRWSMWMALILWTLDIAASESPVFQQDRPKPSLQWAPFLLTSLFVLNLHPTPNTWQPLINSLLLYFCLFQNVT